jgi:outer membrane phospholipase A
MELAIYDFTAVMIMKGKLKVPCAPWSRVPEASR